MPPYRDQPLQPPAPDEIRLPDGDELHAMRVLCQLSTREVYDRSGVTRSTVRAIERGDSDPKLSTVRKILAVYREARA